jgi:hypothetical protein
MSDNTIGFVLGDQDINRRYEIFVEIDYSPK